MMYIYVCWFKESSSSNHCRRRNSLNHTWMPLVIEVFTCVAEGESRSRSAVTPSVHPSVCPSVCPSVRPKILSSQLLWNYWFNYHETWYVDGTSYVVMHIGRKFWSPHFCGSYAPWNLENTHKWPCHRSSSETILIRFSWNLVCR